MKKLIALIFALLLTLSVTACGGDTTDNDASVNNSTEQNGNTSSTVSDTDNTTSSELVELPLDSSTNGTTESTQSPTDTSSKDNTSKDNTSGNTSIIIGGEVEIPVGNDWWSEEDNVFINENNNWYNPNTITINPKRVYWQDGKLYAECFIVNGYDYAVNSIKVNSLSFSNSKGKLAEAGFPMLNITLPTHTHYVHTFIFNSDTVISYGGELKSLITNSNCSFKY